MKKKTLALVLAIMMFVQLFAVQSVSAESGHIATFETAEHFSIVTYDTKDYSTEGIPCNGTAIAKNSDTGIANMDGDDQVNFKVILDEGYVVDTITVTPTDNFKNLKPPAETGAENTWRITKVKGDITIKVSVRESISETKTGKRIVFENVEYSKSQLKIKTTPDSKITFLKGNNVLDNRNIKASMSSGVDVTYNADGSITLNGSGGGYIDIYGDHGKKTEFDNIFEEGKYTTPKMDKTGATGNFNLFLCVAGESSKVVSAGWENKTFEISKEQAESKLYGVWYWFSGCTFDNFTLYPMIVNGANADPIAYEPFCAQEATADSNGEYSSFIPFTPKTTIITSSDETTATLDKPTIEFKEKYYKVGDTIEISSNFLPEGTTFNWYSNETLIASNQETYTLTEDDLCSFISVDAVESEEVIATDKFYFSNLPVVNIDVEDGQKVVKKEYYDAVMEITDAVNGETLYNGKTEIKGRGNSSWIYFDKKPYKLKLDSSTNLFGMGKSKHWVLLANYLDESLVRNTIASDIATNLGVISMQSVWVDLIVNGEYYGNYQFCEHVRIDKNRVPIYNWDDAAEDIAKEVCSAEGLTDDDEDAIKEQLETDFSWITSDEFEYNDVKYTVSDYFEIPENKLQGLLIEVSEEYDELSKFKTTSEVPVMVNSPEYLFTNQDMMDMLQERVQLFEDAVNSPDGYATKDGQKIHFTEMVDTDELLGYSLVCMFMKNELGYKSTYFFFDENSKMHFGPVWDFDFSSGSNSPWGAPSDKGWKLYNWFASLLKNPNFALKFRDKYYDSREYLLSLAEDGGAIDTYYNAIKHSGEANSDKWFYKRGFEQDVAELKSWIIKRVEWIDKQLETKASTLSSFGIVVDDTLNIKPDDSETIQTTQSADYGVLYKDTSFVATSETAEKVSLYINNQFIDTYELKDNSATIVVPKAKLVAETVNIIEVRNSDDLTKSNCTTVFVKDPCLEEHSIKPIPAKPASCTETGLTEGQYCDFCDEVLVEQEIIEKLPHTEKVLEAKPASCDEDGLTEGVGCSECGEVLVAQETIKRNTHNKLKNIKLPTYFAEGYSGDNVCDDCGEVLDKGFVLPKLKLKTPKAKVTAAKKAVTIKITNKADANKLQVRYKLKGAKKYKTKTFATTKALKKIAKLKTGKQYVISFRGVKTSGALKCYSAWSKAKTYKVK